MRRAAVIPSAGIGDALLMLIAVNHLRLAGYKVTLFHDKILDLQSYFEGVRMRPLRSLNELGHFDYVLWQNDNSKMKEELISLRDKKLLKRLGICYFNYNKSKHGAGDKEDFIFDPNKRAADNLAQLCSEKFNTLPLKEIGLRLPEGAIYRKNIKRVAIHPTSNDMKKNFPEKKFLQLGRKLLQNAYHPAIVVSLAERGRFLYAQDYGIDVPLINDLSDFIRYVYESGYLIGNDSMAGHIASYLKIPGIILASSKKRMRLWEPGWGKVKIISPLAWIPNLGGARLREKYWGSFISVGKIVRSFLSIAAQKL